MITDNEALIITKAYNKYLTPEDDTSINFALSLYYNRDNLYVSNGWIYCTQWGHLVAFALHIETGSRDFQKMITEVTFDGSITSIEYMQGQESYLGIQPKSLTLTADSFFLFNDNTDFLNRVGKQYHRFRTSYKYLQTEGLEVLHFDQEVPMGRCHMDDILYLNNVWKKHKKATSKERIGYDINNIVRGVFTNGSSLTPHYSTLVYYKGSLLHFHISEALSPNCILLLDSRTDYSMPKETERQFQYMSFLQHYLHISYWSGIKSDKEKPLLINTGRSSSTKSYKLRLRPTLKSIRTVSHKILGLRHTEEEKPSSLF